MTSQSYRSIQSEGEAEIEFRIGEQVALGLSSPLGMNWYQSQIDDFTDTVVQAAAPLDRLQVVETRRGQDCALLFTRSNDARYLYRTTVDRLVPGVRPELWLLRNGTWQRIQQRGDVRLPVTFDRIRCIRLDKDDPTEFPVSIRDISASGIQIWSQDTVHVGDEVSLSFAIPGTDQEIRTVVEIVRLEERRGATLRWRAGARFRGLRDRDREQIIRFIFQQQRQQLRRRG